MRKYSKLFVSFVEQQPNVGLGRLTVEVTSSHTGRHTQPVGLLCTSHRGRYLPNTQ